MNRDGHFRVVYLHHNNSKYQSSHKNARLAAMMYDRVAELDGDPVTNKALGRFLEVDLVTTQRLTLELEQLARSDERLLAAGGR